MIVSTCFSKISTLCTTKRSNLFKTDLKPPQLYVVDNCLEDWKIAVSGRTIAQLLLELAVCSIHPLPINRTFFWVRASGDAGVSVEEQASQSHKDVLYEVSLGR